ncbi:unnamed protein product [Schistocephalus solidus]|uniref:Golgi apparatus membrane protein TVP23 homolog n=1 Tax=Schistocephalus solidus TaxID=70667 RepID=A0A0X3PSL3_SCHSO|nr:unnamed protein product [Schistocephalus solidus]
MLTARDDVVLTLTEDDDALPVSADGVLSRRELARRRKLALFAHFFVRSLALLTYLFCSWFTTAFIVPVVCILTFFAVDFWLVKNVSGRLLVGLRWWNHVDPTTGKSQWLFESANTASATGQPVTGTAPFGRSRQELAAQKAATRASRLFWIGLFLFPVIWFLLLLAAILSLKLAWALVALSGCFMCSVNLYGYLRCRFQSKSSGSDGDVTQSSMLSMLRASVTRAAFADLWGGSGTAATAPPEQPKPEV